VSPNLRRRGAASVKRRVRRVRRRGELPGKKKKSKNRTIRKYRLWRSGRDRYNREKGDNRTSPETKDREEPAPFVGAADSEKDRSCADKGRSNPFEVETIVWIGKGGAWSRSGAVHQRERKSLKKKKLSRREI